MISCLLLTVTACIGQTAATGLPPGFEQEQTPEALPEKGTWIAEGLHWELTQVLLADNTDHHDNLVQQHQYLLHKRERLQLQGNVFMCRSTITNQGMLFVRKAPLPHARPEPAAWDLSVRLSPNGFALTMSEPLAEWHRLPFSDGQRGATAALQQWQRQQRLPGHHLPNFITSTWGDRSRDSRVRHDFIMAEVKATAAIGADALAIDDGWQLGRSMNTADQGGGTVDNFRAANPDYWTVDPERFPAGLEPIVASAKKLGISIALWFAPDRHDQHAAWQADADTILTLHRRYQVNLFKIDFVDTTTRQALENFQRLVDRVTDQSGGAVQLEFDCTASRRPGYFGVPHGSNLFIENRYTDSASYWPHHTLRNLWQLSQWVDPRRIRMEVLNPRRNREKYGDDPLAPGTYSADTLLAYTLPANPLGWFEASHLEPADADAIGTLARIWRNERKALAECHVEPVGNCPDGIGISGFRWWHPQQECEYLLVLRGIGDANSFDIESLKPVGKVTTLAGNGKARAIGQNLDVSDIPQRGFLWLRY